MLQIDRDWLQDFDEAMLRLYAIDHTDAGRDGKELAWYCDLPAGEAALAYGEDFDLCRVDTFWPPSGLRKAS